MKKNIYMLLIVAGYLSFIFNSKNYLIFKNPFPLILSVLLFIYAVFQQKSKNNDFILNLFPFTSGILSFVMRIFYMDKFDYADRLNSLILLSLVFSIIIIMINEKLHIKLLNSFNNYSLKKRLVLIFVITELFFIISSFLLIKGGVLLLGDEPHYLAISHSIAKDGDINVFNQYARNEYRYFIDYRLRSHAKEGKGFKKWYSIHLPGLSFTLAPFMLFKMPFKLLYFLLRIFMGLFGSGVAVLIYLFLIRLVKNNKLPLFLTAVFMLTTPVFFMSIHIFAEIQALFLILLSLYLAIFYEKKSGKLKLILSGLFMALSIFWGLKYLLFLAMYLLGFGIYFLKEKRFKDIILISVFPFFSVILFAYYLYYAYGSISPTAIYTGIISAKQKAELIRDTKMISLSARVETLLDYFFDQRDGLILYNPFYLFFFPGLILALKRYKKYFMYILISIPAFVYLLYHGYSTIRAGYCPQARYLTPIAWVFLIFSAVYYIESKNTFFKKLFLLLPIYSIFITVYQVFNPFTLYQQTTHDSLIRQGLLFQKFGNLYFDISKLLPSFAKIDGNFRYLPNLIFFVFTILFIYFALRKSIKVNEKFLSLFLFVGIFTVISLFPKVNFDSSVYVKNDTKIPYKYYLDKINAVKVHSNGEFEINNDGKNKLYISIPNSFYMKNKRFLKGLSANFKLVVSEFPIRIEIYNFNSLLFSKKIADKSFEINVKNIKFNNIKRKKISVFTVNVKKTNKKPIRMSLKLFFPSDKLNAYN